MAKDIAYDKHALEAPADAPFVIDFKNEDPAAIPHDVDIHAARRQTVVANQEPIHGGTSAQLHRTRGSPPGPTRSSVPSTRSRAMTGTLTVK